VYLALIFSLHIAIAREICHILAFGHVVGGEGEELNARPFALLKGLLPNHASDLGREAAEEWESVAAYGWMWISPSSRDDAWLEAASCETRMSR